MIKTGYDLLEHQTGGFHKGELISIIGRPLMGRTMFVLNLYRNLIIEGRHKAAFLTSECPVYKAMELLNRMMNNERLNVSDSVIDVSNCQNVDVLNDIIRQLVYKDGINVIILDSLHYLTLFDDVANLFLYEKLADVSRRIKQLAKELGITIIMTSRTNYMVDEREGFQGMLPQLSDTNKIGDLAYYSDVVLGLYRPEVDSVFVDMKGYDLHDVLYVFVLKSRKRITDLFIKCSISTKSGLITENEVVTNKDIIPRIIDEDAEFISDALLNKGKELWTFIREFNNNLDITNLKKYNLPLFNGTMNILDLITISKGYQYELSCIYEAFSGYHTTITLQGEGMKEKDACHDDIAMGLETKGHPAITPVIIWQIYLFCKLFRGVDYAEWYYGMPIFEISDIDINKFRVVHEEDREPLRQAFAQLQVDKSLLLPQITSDQEGLIHHVKCTWWFPSEGLVQETISYYSARHRTMEYNSNKEIIIPYNSGEMSDFPI